MKWSDLKRLDGYLPPDMEKAYRQFYLKADIRVAGIVLGFLCALVAVFAYNDYEIFGFTSTFYFLAALRSLYLAFFIALIIYLRRTKNPSRFDLSLLISLIAGFLLLATINLSRPSNYLGTFAVDIIVILIIYLGVPIRLLFRAGAALFLSLVEILTFVFIRETPTVTAMYTVVVVLLAANLIGILASTRLYAFRRGQFKAAAELRKSTDFLNETGKTAKVGGWEFDVGSKLQRWTEEVYHIHELDLSHQPTVEEGINYYAPEVVPVISAAVERAIETGEPFDLELPFITARGNRRWVHTLGRGYRENGKITRVAGTFQDITRRKIAEDKIKLEAEQWQTTFDAITDLVSIQDKDHKLVRVNKAYANTFKLNPEELTGSSCFQVVHGTTCPIDNCPHSQVMQTKTSASNEIFEPRLGIYIEVSCSPIRNEKGEIEGSVHIIKDITQRKKDEEERKLAAERIQDLYNKAPAGYHSLDKDGLFVQINDTELAWLGYSREEIIGKKRFSDIITDEGRETFKKNFPILKERGWVKDLEFDVVRKNGSRMSVVASSTAIKDEYGNFLSSRSTIFDVTETRQLQRDIAESEKKYRTILEEMNDAYFELDLAGKITMANNTTCRMLLTTKEELIGKSSEYYVSGDEAKTLLASFKSIYETGTPSKGMVFSAIRKDGRMFYAEISVSPMRNEKGEFVGFRCVGRDVSERVELQNKIAKMAMHDSLTNLPNRSLLYDRFNIAQGQAERGNRKMALMELDLDHFKLINDTMGHAAGDELLQAVALRLTSVVRKSDTVARLGGDEFAVLLPEISRIDDVAVTAGKILAAFQQPFTIEGTELTVTTSIGIAIYPDNGATIDKLLEAADTAMYDVKGHGRNNYELAGKK